MFQHIILSYHKALYREVFNAELSTTEQKSSSIAMQQLMSSALRRAVGHQSGTSRNESRRAGCVVSRCAAVQH